MKAQTFDEEFIIGAALNAGFMISTHYGQKPGQPMPVSNSRTLIAFAKAMHKAGAENAARICESDDNKDRTGLDCADAIRDAARGG